MIYLDSRYIFKCYINEPGTREVLSIVQNSSGSVAVFTPGRNSGLAFIVVVAKR